MSLGILTENPPQDGTGDVFFNLDSLWSSPNVDAVAVDVYWPLADWRDGASHSDYAAGWRSTAAVSLLLLLKSAAAITLPQRTISSPSAHL